MTTDHLPQPVDQYPDIAVVLIGRNEGQRLVLALETVLPSVEFVVYVDSGSGDGSVSTARNMGATVVELDMAEPFTAARARNAGLEKVRIDRPGTKFVQFMDGDCMVERGWIARAQEHLLTHSTVAAVMGRRTELHPERSIYNRLCDMDWNAPPGEAKHFGGDVMLRMESLNQVGGYRADVIAGEEPELSIRLRQKGWKIECLDQAMTLHDANMTQFRQWWIRTVRTGYAFALGAYLFGSPPEYHWVRESRRAWFWAFLVPSFIVALAVALGPRALVLFLIYPIQVLRLFLKRQGDTEHPLLASVFHVIDKFPQLAGQIKFHKDRLLGRTTRLIEYK